MITTMASVTETVPFRLEGYLAKLDLMKQFAREALEACRNEKDKQHLTDIYNCYAFAAEQTLNFVGELEQKGEAHGTQA